MSKEESWSQMYSVGNKVVGDECMCHAKESICHAGYSIEVAPVAYWMFRSEDSMQSVGVHDF